MDTTPRLDRRLCVDTGSSPRAIIAHARRRSLLALMLLALVLASASQSPAPLLAAPASDEALVDFEVWAFPEKPPILCPGRTQKIYVSVHKDIIKTINAKSYNIPGGAVTGVKISGEVSNNVGTLAPKQVSVSAADDELSGLSPKGVKGLGEADFLFTAKKAGTAELTFRSDVPGDKTGSTDPVVSARTIRAKEAKIQVKVIPCKLMVTNTAHFPANGLDNPDIPFPPIDVAMDVATLTPDANGHFSGSADLHWKGHTLAKKCTVVESFAAASQASLEADISDSGELTLNVTYEQPGVGHSTTTCNGASVSADTPYWLDPIKVIEPTSGGTLTLAQGYDQSTIVGTVDVSVTPVEDGSTAFNLGAPPRRPDSLPARTPMFWHDLLPMDILQSLALHR